MVIPKIANVNGRFSIVTTGFVAVKPVPYSAAGMIIGITFFPGTASPQQIPSDETQCAYAMIFTHGIDCADFSDYFTL